MSYIDFNVCVLPFLFFPIVPPYKEHCLISHKYSYYSGFFNSEQLPKMDIFFSQFRL